jgi:hypothetical protein
MHKSRFIILSTLLLLAACTPQAVAVTPTAMPATETSFPPTNIPEPTSTPTPKPSPMATEIAEEVVLQPPENLAIDEFYWTKFPLEKDSVERFEEHTIRVAQINREDVVVEKIPLSDDVDIRAYAKVWIIDETGQPIEYMVPFYTYNHKDNTFVSLGSTVGKITSLEFEEKIIKYHIEAADIWENGDTQYFKLKFYDLDTDLTNLKKNEEQIAEYLAFWKSIPVVNEAYDGEKFENFVKTGDPENVKLEGPVNKFPPRLIFPISSIWRR